MVSNLRCRKLAISEARNRNELIRRGRGERCSSYPGAALRRASFIVFDGFYECIEELFKVEILLIH